MAGASGPDPRLERYKARRDFAVTPEPAETDAGKTSTGLRYCVQEHAARRRHFDFRLELDGVLKSWAVPNGPSLDPAERRLAVATEDHPLAYADFEGVIPEGEYGGGTVMLWDRGTWQAEGDPRDGLARGKLRFTLDGERLKGRWNLVRMAKRGGEAGKEWLLIKGRDGEARSGPEADPNSTWVTSVASGRSMEAIAADRDRVWRSGDPVTAALPAPGGIPGARPALLPRFVDPALATLVAKPPETGRWLHEIKFDGYRAQCRIADGAVKFLTRRGHDWTDKFRSLAEAAKRLPVTDALIDGEVVTLGPNGASDFAGLQEALSERRTERLRYYAFDLLHWDGQDLTAAALEARKSALQALLERLGPDAPLLYSDHMEGRGGAFFRHACRLALEGVVSKRADSPYRPGRGKDWVKVKCIDRQEFVIGGFAKPAAGPGGVGALLLGVYDDAGRLTYAGRVGTGFTQAEADALRRRLDSLRRDDPPFADPPDKPDRGVIWAEPRLVCEVEFLAWTGEGKLRHPSFKGLREDRAPETVVRERAPEPEDAALPAEAEGREPVVAGIRLTHPDRILYPHQGLTKRGLAAYYDLVAERMLPHVARRPLSLVRCPAGRHEACFYQRHHAKGMPDAIRPGPPEKPGEKEPLLYIEDKAGLVALVQFGVLEIHPWGARVDDLEHPDRIIFDLDPDPALPFASVADAAREVRDRLEKAGLKSFLKVTGGKGLHVVTPITPGPGWAEVKAFARGLAEAMADAAPRRFVTSVAKKARTGRIFIDFLRNDRGATAVAPYSTRAREGAPVAAPLTWDELDDLAGAAAFTVMTLPRRLRHLSTDPWDPMAEAAGPLPAGG